MRRAAPREGSLGWFPSLPASLIKQGAVNWRSWYGVLAPAPHSNPNRGTKTCISLWVLISGTSGSKLVVNCIFFFSKSMETWSHCCRRQLLSASSFLCPFQKGFPGWSKTKPCRRAKVNCASSHCPWANGGQSCSHCLTPFLFEDTAEPFQLFEFARMETLRLKRFNSELDSCVF